MKRRAALMLIAASVLSYAKDIVNPTAKARPITVTNKISERMTTYHLLGTDYVPEFQCTVNGIPMKHGCKTEIPIVDNTFVVKYRYNFAQGYCKGAKEVTFEIEPDKKECVLEFSWKNSWRVLASQAKPKKIKKVNYST